MLPKITNYWDTAQDAIPRFAAELSALSPTAAKETTTATRAAVTEHLRVLPDKLLLLAAVAVANDLYRAASTIAFWNTSVADYLGCSAATFFGLLSQRGYRLHYVIDNSFEDLQRPTQLFPLWFQACGIVYICPQLLALDLMRSDGVAVADDSVSLAHHIAEARHLGDRIVQKCREEARHYVYLETDFQDGSLDTALQGRGEAGVLSLFRNEAPVLGSKVAVVLPKQKLG